jgi:Fe-S oxidoreductase
MNLDWRPAARVFSNNSFLMAARLVFLALCIASLGYFLRVLWLRLAPLRDARPRLPFDRLGSLVSAFAEVMLQTRVIGDRPVAGTLHALVMWGFFAFGWVSLEHLWRGIVGLDPTHAAQSWYGAFAALWAVAVLIGIAGLALRRFVLRPPALGKLSVSSGVVAALIAALMITYLIGWRGVADPMAWKINWWAHTLAFLGMFWAIPNSKHLHLVLGPVAVLFRSETTSSIRPLREDDDDDLGMLRFRDLSQKDVLDIHACVECGRCTEACPANVIGGSLNPKEIILQLQRGQLAGGDVLAGTSGEVEAGKAWVSEGDLYQCLSCGACEQACPVGIEHVGYKILDMRRGLVSEGRTHNDKLTDLFTTMERSPHNPWGVPHDTRRKLIESEKLPVFDGSQEWLFWLGCGASYDPHGQDVVRAMAKVLNAAGVSWGVLARETCCGEPARRAGNEYLYMELSQQVIDSLGGKKVTKLLSCDPHCTRMFDVDYRQNPAFEALGVAVRHHTEFLNQVLPSLNLQPESKKITYHDPCYLSRGRGVTDEPRELLRQIGGELVEMEHHGKRTFCCGAGGAQLFIADDKVELPGGRVNHRRFAEAEATGAAAIAVACPYCPIMLKDAAQHAKREDIEVLDVAELVAARLR